MREEVAAFLREHEAAWQLAVTGEDRWKEEVVRLGVARRGLAADPVGYRRLHDWQGRRAELADPILARQVRELYLEFRASQMDLETLEALERLEAEAEQRFDTFRSTLDGQPATANALEEILRASGDAPLRQRAWEASQQIGPEVAPLVREMVGHRNRVARKMGFPDHFAFALETRELEEDRLFLLLEEVDRRTAGPSLVEKARLDAELCARFGVTAGELRPWHYADPFFQRPPPRRDLNLDPLFAVADLPALMVASFDGMGLEVRDILARSDLFEKPGKSQHGFCADIDREGDIRILCNLVGNEHWMRTPLHEGGHAVYDKYLRERVFAPADRWPWSRLVAEATEGPLSPEALAVETGGEGR